jgi:hypothetical protein
LDNGDGQKTEPVAARSEGAGSGSSVPLPQSLPESVPAAASVESIDADTGVYKVAGVLVGRIDLMEHLSRGVAPITGNEIPPPGLRGLALLRWIYNAECAFNPLTVFDVYISLLGMAWGFFLLLPMQTFAAVGRLWEPVRTLFGNVPGGYWYDSGAEIFVGFMMLFFHSLHLLAVFRRKRGDTLRGVTACVILAGWLCLQIIFAAADPTVQNFFVMMVTNGFLFGSLRGAGIR